MSKPKAAPAPETKEERRQFLERIGKYAAVTPPAITMMLAASTVPAYAKGSGHGGGEEGDKGKHGNHGNHGGGGEGDKGKHGNHGNHGGGGEGD